MVFVRGSLIEDVCRSLLSGLHSLAPSMAPYCSQVCILLAQNEDAHFFLLQSEFNLQFFYKRNQTLSEKAVLATGGICH